MILNPAARVRILSEANILYKGSIPAQSLPEPSSFRVPDQLNIKAVTGACKLIDGCSLELCSATPSVASSDIYAMEIKAIQLHDSIVMASP